MRVAEGARTGHVALYSALFPVMAGATTGRGDRAAEALRWSWWASVAASVLIAAALVVLGPVMIAVLYGPDFGPAGPALAILALSVVPSTAATWRSLALLAAHREPAVLRAVVVGVVILAVLLAVLVPAVGWIGACWAVLLADVGQLTVLVAADRETAFRQPRYRRGAVPFGSSTGR